ncbi:unhealthy ribosome biogenesis protein 2 homolog isoform X1 [Falco biarmicus]|uniref:unhealthy ribosome biogenesis protein 2 homolog isoform X1 n=1 Tax=Falco rusticolus TaxID=120794 RepID=UPI000392E76D|nr:unhealthy ribosome biogenesis protein 2 homolog isoform X1 [Falco rusticolus]XP_037247488.1 unhealthy ribosome biogenesis protein 2 homolog isoform X1 [Falco rusticolus]XP_037247489.1 unhealthy ribosome biogenesis protein 2 homolog isoform X1 [Falco rusticolus]XP_037247490.1 unhealthy ribosome biogenesis protein 2 homolog isoform X1 [Falco rusticolus]XP_055569907.1 unhealthy ribosome biogenesis protein 2 homolog isoform X1 [Falco cherrug]XP_055569908.1 unhealthy ribosome biogenesis protein 
MAAIYSGIYLKLKSAKTPWEDKLKLARFAWVSHQCVLPNKEQVLLDWVSHVLVSYYSKKYELEDEVVEKLWVYLDNIIHSRRLQDLLKSGKTIGLSFSIAQVINERLSEACSQKTQQNIGTVLSCSSGILSTPSLSIIYTAKCELLVDLLSKLAKLACQQLASDDAVGSQLFRVLQLTFTQYLLIQRQQTNPNRVFGQVTSHLLQPCLLLRHWLTVRSWTQADDNHVRQHLSREIRNQVETLLQAGLFQPELFLSYKEELLPEQNLQEKKKGALKSVLLPVSTVQTKLGSGFCEPALHGAAVAGSVSLLYKLFLDSYCKAENHLVCFHMLSSLFGCLRLSGLQQGVWEDMLSPADWSTELLALEQLLNLVLSSDIYNVARDRIRHKEVQFGFYRKLAQVLLRHSQASIPAWFRCLKLLMSLNHLIVEPDLDDLVASAWIDAEVSEPRTKKPQEALINTMFQTYSKLRQFPRLFEEVLTVICQPAADQLRLPVFSAGLTVKLHECLLELPPNQILDILCLFVEKCQTFIIPDVEGSVDMALKLLSVSLVLHAFLFNMRSLDDVTPSPVVLRTQSLLAKMQKGIIQPLMELLQAPRREEEKSDLWLRKASDSALLLVYTWVEVDTLFGVSCSKYVSPKAEIAAAVTEPAARHWGISALLPGVEEQCWERVMELANSFASTSKYCLELLTLQKIKMILIQTKADLQTLQHATAFILESGRSSMNRGESEPWDGDIGAISDLTYPTAHWHLIISNLTILLPFMSLKDVEYLANVLLETLVLAKDQEAAADQESFISIGKVSLGLMHSSFLPEMKVLHCAFLTSLIRRFARVLPTAAKDSVDQPVQQLSAGNIPWHEEMLAHCRSVDLWEAPSENKLQKNEFSLSWKTLEKVAQCIVLLAKSCCPVILKESQLESCLGLLEIASLLKLDSLLPSDCTRCFLVLLSLLANTRARVSCSKLLLLKFLSTCFRLLRCLQAGRNASCIFKVFHASDVLEAVMTSQLTASKFFTDVLTVPVWGQYLQEAQAFLENFLQMIIERRQSVRLNLEKFMSFLVSCKSDGGAAKSKGWKNWNPAAGQLLLMAFTTLCHVVTLHLQQLPEKKLQSANVLSALLEPVVVQMVRTVEDGLQSNTENEPLPVAFIPSVTTLLKADLSHAVKKGWQKEPSGFLEQPRIKLYQKFYSQILRELPCAGGNLQFLQSALQFLTIFCSVPELYPGKETAVMVVFAIKKLLSGPAITTQMIQSMQIELTEVLVQLLGNCSAEEFYTIMRLVLQGLEMRNVWQQKAKEVLSAVTLTKLLLSCPLSGDKEKAFWFASPQIITALAMQTKEACQDQSLVSTIVIPILETAAALLRQGEGILLNPHHVALSFSILLTVPLDHLKTEDYRGVFLGVHEVLFSIVQCHPKVLLKAAPSFLNSFHRLVVSVMHEGRQKGDRGNTDEFEVILKCAHLVERMYTHIAAEMEDFTVFSAFIVAQYVTELQKVTLHPAVKKHLTEGIYHILDLCIERDVKFLNASLPAGVREVFKDLYNDYNHYHKAKKQGEEKYTA